MLAGLALGLIDSKGSTLCKGVILPSSVWRFAIFLLILSAKQLWLKRQNPGRMLRCKPFWEYWQTTIFRCSSMEQTRTSMCTAKLLKKMARRVLKDLATYSMVAEDSEYYMVQRTSFVLLSVFPFSTSSIIYLCIYK